MSLEEATSIVGVEQC